MPLLYQRGVGLGPQLFGLLFVLPFGSLFYGLVIWLIWELGRVLLSRWTEKRSALSSRLTLVWPSTKQRRRTFLRNARRGLLWGLLWALLVGGLFYVTAGWLVVGLVFVLVLTPALALVFGLVEPRSVLITSRTMTEASSRSLITALTWTLIISLVVGLIVGLVVALVVGLLIGPFLALNNGGWFVLLQKVAHRRLARAGNLPPGLYDFLEWGVGRQLFRRVGGGVRFRHNLIQQHLANASEGDS